MGTDIAAGNALDAADTAMNVVADAVTAGAMDLKQAMRQRHTVRKFTSEPLSPELISQLNDRVRANNERLGLAISLKVGDGVGAARRAQAVLRQRRAQLLRAGWQRQARA